jgi:HAD superfamily hydrolase (TIGR01450 family)
MSWVLDLDGVVWLAGAPIPGAAAAIDRLRAAGEQVVFVTNFSTLTSSETLERLRTAGVEADSEDVLTSAMAAASLVRPGEQVLVLAGPGVWEAVEAAGARPVEPVGRDSPPVEAVIVGYHTTFDYDRLAAGQQAVRSGARLIATNSDPTYPTPERLLPGGGSLVAAVETASQVRAMVAGKPHSPMADLVHRRVGSTPGDPANAQRHIVVGDLPSTDGLLAARLGYRFGLVLSGVTAVDGVPDDPAPDHVADDLAALVAELMNRR